MGGGNIKDFRSIGHVPIIGQEEVEVFEIRPMVVAKCKCGTTDAQVFTILDPTEIVQCKGCGKAFTLKMLQFLKNNAGDIQGSCTVSRVMVRHRA